METDLGLDKNLRLLDGLSSNSIRINYDIGNSASLGFSPEDEWSAYGENIFNIHIKDRSLNGPTVRLGLGNANFEAVHQGLKQNNYLGNWVLQTAHCNNKR